MDSLRSNKSKRDQRSFDSSRPAGWLLAVFVGLPLLQSTPVAAQISPATLPDLKLALAGRALAIALQEDGKVIIGGDFTGVNGVPRKSIARLNPNGSVDATWNPNVSWVGGASQGTVETIAVMGTNVFVGGYFLEVGGQSRVGIAKLTETGSVDPTWNVGFSLADPQYAVATMAVSGTNLYVGGPVRIRSVEGHNITNIFKVNTITGTIDETWAPNPNGLVRQLVVHDGWVYAGGDFTSISGQGTRYLARLHPITGAVDATWVPDPNDRIFAIAISGDDAFVAGSFSTIGGLNKNRLAKLSTLGGGSTDNAWSPNPSGSFNLISALAISDGRIYIGGSFTSIGGQSRSNVARLDMTGTGLADPIWNPNCDGAVGDIAVSGADIYLGGGFASIAEVDSFGAAKVNSATGSPDKSFNARLELPGQAAAIAIQSDRKVIVGGSFISAGGLPRRNLVRLNPDGTMDLAWAPNPNGTVVGLAVSGSDIFVSGGFTRIGGLNRMRLAKLSARSDAADAQWDPAPSDPFGPRIDALAVDGSNLYVGGTFTWIGGQRKISLAKLSTTGTGAADPMWSPNPMSSNPNYPSGLVSSLALSGSDIFVGGLFYLVGGQSRNDLAKLSTTGTGSADPSWNPNPNAFVEALAVSGTNIFVAGGFSIIGGQSISNLAKLSTLGTGECRDLMKMSPC